MPRYEFRCEECLAYQETQIHFEVGPECPVCYRTMKRVWSAPGVQFKGSGFYKTDNQNQRFTLSSVFDYRECRRWSDIKN